MVEKHQTINHKYLKNNMLRLNYINSIIYTLLLQWLFITTTVEAATASSTYSIVLASSPGQNLKWVPKKNIPFPGLSFYVSKVNIKSKPWERLQLGFFNNRKQAIAAQSKIKAFYPGSWVIKTPPKAEKSIIFTVPSQAKLTSIKNTSSLSDKQLNNLMRRAKTDLRYKNYSSAIRYLNALVSAGTHKYSISALELLGLARQRKGQKTHAVTLYTKYLKLYPDSEGSDRVRQRLAGLLTAASGPKKKIRLTTTQDLDEVTTYGSFSQFYRSNQAETDNTDSIKTLSQLITFADVTTLQRSGKYDHRYQFTADHIYDFINDKDNSEFRFVETYYELSYRKTGTSGKIGRQSLRIGGLLNRFDGISAGYQFNPDMRLNILGGYPVEIDNKTSINENRTFYGLTFETGTFLNNWNMNLFYFDQEFNGFDDRTSTGTEIYYRDKTKSLFGMIDYDLLYDEINILQFNANILLDQGRTAYMNAFMRKAPILSTSNALIGRQEISLEELGNTLNIEQIYQLAEDRTADSQTITLGGSQRMNSTYQANADLTFSRVEETIASGGVPATPGTGTDYFVSTQIVGNSLLIARDTGVLGLRYSNTQFSNTTSLIANTRFPITRNWRINPRLQYDIRSLTGGRSQNKLRAIFRTDYNYLNKARFDFEIGYDKTDEDNSSESLGSNNLFFTLGYRWNF
ncbi:MAG: hypothetical protein DIZ80_02015 [endosymbiont of Galathealinum brachiosum]|uniref:SPOR domain-containing protein n=1 Tax=endosymbiont of Galathealinum brachiosum TaxID=2200906 RepID=A0A370DNK7_9GAMM|nr:MAG: hypothetical protein DIZ80_02015 [endosymbiont of Galathealinum brachiosum]